MGKAFFCKNKITDGKNLIQKQDGRLDLHGNGKGQTNGHSAGVVLDLQLHKLLQLGKVHYLLIALRDFLPRHSHDRGVEKNILATSQFWIKPDPQLQHRCDAPMNCHFTPLVGSVDACQNFEQSGFAGTIPANDTKELALHDFKVNVIQSLASLHLIALMKFHEALAQRAAAFTRKAEGFGKVFYSDCGLHKFRDPPSFRLPSI